MNIDKAIALADLIRLLCRIKIIDAVRANHLIDEIQILVWKTDQQIDESIEE